MSDYLDLASHRMHFRVDGERGAPAIVFCNSLGANLHMWDEQAEALAKTFRIVRYDRRGHGLSSTAASTGAALTIADLGADVLALMDHLRIERAHFCGLSIGGLVGQWLGTAAADRFQTLILCATSARIGTMQSWQERAGMVRSEGLQPLLDATRERWFSPEFAARNPARVKAVLDDFARNSAEGYAQCCDALAQADFRDSLARIRMPVLCIAGQDDAVCTPQDLVDIAQGVAQGEHVSVPGRHICNIESPTAFNTSVASFLNEH